MFVDKRHSFWTYLPVTYGVIAIRSKIHLHFSFLVDSLMLLNQSPFVDVF